MRKKYKTSKIRLVTLTGERPIANSILANPNILTYPQRGEQSEGGDALVKEDNLWENFNNIDWFNE